MTYSGKRKLDSLTDHINSATPPNELKWRQLLVNGKLGQYDFSRADVLVNQLVDADIVVRGHNLIWGKWAGTTFPKALNELVNNSKTPAITLQREMRAHITTVMHHFKGRITRWDVVNEPLTMSNEAVDDNFFHQLLGENYIAEAFKMARAADAHAKLFLNEDFRSFSPETTERFLSLLHRQLAQGAPIDGIGIQSHHLYRLKDTQAFQVFVDQLHQLGLIFEITELDVPIWLFADSDNPYQAQGDYYRKYSQVCYHSPHCLGVTTWGIDDSQTWLDSIFPFSLRSSNKPLIFDDDMQKKPAYQGVVAALLEK